MIVARLMHVLANESGDGEHSPLKFMRVYTCIEPECTFVSCWNRRSANVILEPDKVFIKYIKGGLLVDVLTGFPIQWVIMVLYSPCDKGRIGLLRLLRIIRVTRVFKIFNTPPADSEMGA